MTTFLIVAAGAALVGTILLLIRHAQHRTDARRREDERISYESRARERRRQTASRRILRDVEGHFPFARKGFEAYLAQGLEPKEALAKALAEVPGVTIGMTASGFRAVIGGRAPGLNSHVWACGRSGSGKTSLMVHLVVGEMNAGDAVIVISSETELFMNWLLALVPQHRSSHVIYVAPGRADNPVRLNILELEPGMNRDRAAGDLYNLLKAIIGNDAATGARFDAFLSVACAALVGRPGETLWSIKRLVEDPAYRARVAAETADSYIREFLSRTFDELPAGAHLPLITRLNKLLLSPVTRRCLCARTSGFSSRQVLEDKLILFVDLGNMDAEAQLLLAGIVVSRAAQALFAQENTPPSKRHNLGLFADEFQRVTSPQSAWVDLASRSRRYGGRLRLFHQHPGQISERVRESLAANVANCIAMNLSFRDANAFKKELLLVGDDGIPRPVPVERIVGLQVGECIARLSGRYALPVKLKKPIPEQPLERSEEVREFSWRRFGIPDSGADGQDSGAASTTSPPRGVLETHSEVAPAASDRLFTQEWPSAGRGGRQHRLLQDCIVRWADVGFKTEIEQEVLGAGRIDVALEREGRRIAVEVVVRSTPEQTLDTVTRCLAAGFAEVAVVAPDRAALDRAKAKVREELSVGECRKVGFFAPEEFRTHLEELMSAPSTEERPAGYRVVVSYATAPSAEAAERRRALARLVGTVMAGSRETRP